MYIHLLRLNELPDNVYKLIRTTDPIEIVKNIHKNFYDINDDNFFKDSVTFDKSVSVKMLYFIKNFFECHKSQDFIYCKDFNSFINILDNLNSLEINLNNLYTIPQSYDIQPKNKNSTKNITQKKSTNNYVPQTLVKKVPEQKSNVISFMDEIEYYELKDKPINNFEEIVDENLEKDIEKKLEEKEKLNNNYQLFLEQREKELEDIKKGKKKVDKLNNVDEKFVDDWETTLHKKPIQKMKSEFYSLLEDETEEEPDLAENEEPIYDDMILFVNNSVLNNNKVIYDKLAIEQIKNCTYLPEIEVVCQYAVPELDAVKDILDIKISQYKNKISHNIIERLIKKINELLYGDDEDKPVLIKNKNTQNDNMLKEVRNFLKDCCIRSTGRKIYSKDLYSRFHEYCMHNEPSILIFFNKNNFTPLVKKFNYRTRRDRNGIYWLDIDWNPYYDNSFNQDSKNTSNSTNEKKPINIKEI